MIWDSDVIAAMKADAVICNARVWEGPEKRPQSWLAADQQPPKPKPVVIRQPAQLTAKERVARKATTTPLTAKQLAKRAGCSDAAAYKAAVRLVFEGRLALGEPCISEINGQPMKRYVRGKRA